MRYIKRLLGIKSPAEPITMDVPSAVRWDLRAEADHTSRSELETELHLVRSRLKFQIQRNGELHKQIEDLRAVRAENVYLREALGPPFGIVSGRAVEMPSGREDVARLASQVDCDDCGHELHYHRKPEGCLIHLCGCERPYAAG